MADKRYRSREIVLHEVYDSEGDEEILHRSENKEEIEGLRDQLNDEHSQRIDNVKRASKGLRLDVADEVGVNDAS